MRSLLRPEAVRRVRLVLFLGMSTLCLTPWLSSPLALAAGVVLALTLGNPLAQRGHQLSKWLLQGCVVLLGFGMNLPAVIRVGASGALFAVCTITLTLALGYLLGELLGINRRASTLLSVGTAICGGSAIAAVGSAMQAEEGDMTIAMGTVFLLNAAALVLFPIVGHSLHLTQRQFGIWAGVAIHDVSSVVGAAGRYGFDALEVATAVKLSRTLWIVPLALGITFARGRRTPLINATFGFDPAQATPRQLQVPWFIGLFVLASVLRSCVPFVAQAAPQITQVAARGLTLTLFLVGANLSVHTLRQVGWRALVQGLTLWVFISAASLAVVKLT